MKLIAEFKQKRPLENSRTDPSVKPYVCLTNGARQAVCLLLVLLCVFFFFPVPIEWQRCTRSLQGFFALPSVELSPPAGTTSLILNQASKAWTISSVPDPGWGCLRMKNAPLPFFIPTDCLIHNEIRRKMKKAHYFYAQVLACFSFCFLSEYSAYQCFLSTVDDGEHALVCF